MKIVHIEGYFHANAGYQINILPKYLQKMGHKQYILTSQLDLIPDELTSFFGKKNVLETDKAYEEMNNVKIIRLPLKKYISGREIFGPELEEKIKEIDPDVVYVHGNDSYVGIQFIFKYNFRKDYLLITDSHMLDIASKNKMAKLFRMFYRLFITPMIKKNKITVIRTQNDLYVNKHLGIPLNQAPWVPTGSDLLLFHPSVKVKKDFKLKHNLDSNSFIVIYAGKLDESKGGKLLAEAFRFKFKTKKEVVLLCVGNSTGEYGEVIDKIFDQSENNIIKYPTQQYVNLPKFFQSADIALFPKQSSLSFYDAQACGLPVILEDKSINIERVSHNNGKTFISDNLNSLRNKIEYFANLSEEEYKEYSDNSERNIKENFNYEKIASEYEKIIFNDYIEFTKTN